jgi:hypothetical protein
VFRIDLDLYIENNGKQPGKAFAEIEGAAGTARHHALFVSFFCSVFRLWDRFANFLDDDFL